MVPPRQAARSLRRDARRALEDCPAWTLRRVARRLGQLTEARLAATGLSFAQIGLLAEIASANDDTVGALAQRMGLDQSTLSRTLRPLEAAGLVEIATVANDLRKRMVWLTERGARRLEQALVAWRAAQADLAPHLPPAAVRRLARAVEIL